MAPLAMDKAPPPVDPPSPGTEGPTLEEASSPLSEPSPPATTRNPWAFVPLLYFLQGLPVVIVQQVSGTIFTKMELSNAVITVWSNLLKLPWTIKPLWGPLVDLNSTKRRWTVVMQALIFVMLLASALVMTTPNWFTLIVITFFAVAFLSATHDIAADGFYLLALDERKQAFFVGIRSASFRLAMVAGTGGLVYLAGTIEESTADIPRSWLIALGAGAAIYGLGALINAFALPRPALDRSPTDRAPGETRSNLMRTGVVVALGLALFYALSSGLRLIGHAAFLAAPNALNGWNLARLEPGWKPSTPLVGVWRPSEDSAIESLRFRKDGTFQAIADGGGMIDGKYEYRGAAIDLTATGVQGDLSEVPFLPTAKDATARPFLIVEGTDRARLSADAEGLALEQDTSELRWVPVRFVLGALASFWLLGWARRLLRGTEMGEAFASYFQQDKMVPILGFILFYRFGESMISSMASPFLLKARDTGALGLPTAAQGVIWGTIGVLALLAGGLIGGALIAKYGIKKVLWPMVLALNVPNLAYVWLAATQPVSGVAQAMGETSTSILESPMRWLSEVGGVWGAVFTDPVGIVAAVDQFGYGFGFSAYLVYLMFVSQGTTKYQTSHYAISTGLMALGALFAGAISGPVQEALGYRDFFIAVCFLTIPGMITLFFIPMDRKDIKKVRIELD